jgi:hypothetical protein
MRETVRWKERRKREAADLPSPEGELRLVIEETCLLDLGVGAVAIRDSAGKLFQVLRCVVWLEESLDLFGEVMARESSRIPEVIKVGFESAEELGQGAGAVLDKILSKLSQAAAEHLHRFSNGDIPRVRGKLQQLVDIALDLCELASLTTFQRRNQGAEET